MAVNGTNIAACKTDFAEAGVVSADDDAGASLRCLPLQQVTRWRRSPVPGIRIASVLECWRAVLQMPDRHARSGLRCSGEREGGGNDAASTTDSPASDGAAE